MIGNVPDREASKERLKELYHDEVNPRFKAKRMPSVGPLMFASLAIVLVLVATMLYKFNTFIMMQEDVFAKKGHLEGAYQRRINLFENLLKLTLNHATLEHDVFTHVADVRKDIIKKINLPPEIQQAIAKSLSEAKGPDIKDLGQALSSMKGEGLDASMGRLLGIVEQYPVIKSSETYLQMMTSLVEIENRIAQRRMTYQETVLMFNREISRYPWNILAKATDFKRFDYFEAEAKAHYRMQIHSDVFERLMPDEADTIKAASDKPVPEE